MQMTQPDTSVTQYVQWEHWSWPPVVSRFIAEAADIVRKHYISEEQAKTSQLFFPYFAALQTKKVFGYRNSPAA